MSKHQCPACPIAVDCGKWWNLVYGIFFRQKFIGKCAQPEQATSAISAELRLLENEFRGALQRVQILRKDFSQSFLRATFKIPRSPADKKIRHRPCKHSPEYRTLQDRSAAPAQRADPPI